MAEEVGWDRPFFRGRRGKFEVIAHRGGEGQWPSETVFAFKEALNLGVDVIEMDVRSTSDGELVLMHDATVGRTTDGTGRVAFHSLKELQELDAGYKWTDDGGLTF